MKNETITPKIINLQKSILLNIIKICNAIYLVAINMKNK